MAAPTTSDEHVVSWRALMRRLGLTLLVTVLVAAASNLAIEIVQAGSFATVRATTLGEGLPFFLIGTAVVWLLVLLVLAVTGRMWLTVPIVAAATGLVGFINATKLEMRHEPLYPSDWYFALHPLFLLHLLDPPQLGILAGGLAGLVLLALALRWLLRRYSTSVQRATQPGLWGWLLAGRAVVAVTCLSAIGYVGHFNSPDNYVRETYEAQGARWKYWHQAANYAVNGFVGGTLYNLSTEAMPTPRDYTQATMAGIVRQYDALAHRLNKGRTGSFEDTNVVLLLSESFSDPTRINGVDLARDPIPYTRSLMRTTTSGRMLAQFYGGGTANMEFEALTGLSLTQFNPQVVSPYQQLLPRFRSFPSVVGLFKDMGHRAIAIHPFTTTLYQRETVYPILGFDEFVHDETMQTAEKLERSSYISDRSAFAETLHQIDSTERPALVNLVTMQNHYPHTGIYDRPIPVTGTHSAEETAEVGGYARGLSYTDAALKPFIDSLRRSDERTVVLFYGDHLPPVWSKETSAQNSPRKMRSTPFFVWSNFGRQPPKRLTTTSPIYFVNQVYDAADAKLPPYYALLSALHEEIPALARGMMIGPDDQRLDESELSPRAKDLLHDYRLVQYDLTVGHQYTKDGMLYPDQPVAQASGSRE